MKRKVVYLACLAPRLLLAQAEDSAAIRIRFGAFVDVYYAYDASRPRNLDRAFTTQAVRHNEFNLNLGHLEARIDGDRIRGRIALQAGTSVQANYAGEPATGSVSGSALSRHVQEAVVGARLGSRLWLDAGILFSHLGSESWISSDNPTYTRSLAAEFSPYYQAGLRLSWAVGRRVSGSLNLVNGWQKISENNSAKSLGARVELALSPSCTLTLYNLIGNERADSLSSRLRAFHGGTFGCRRGALAVVATADLGVERRAGGPGSNSWQAISLIARGPLAKTLALAGRLEFYHDPHQVIVATGTTEGFRVAGTSGGLDWRPAPHLLARFELRALFSRSPLFEDANSSGGLARRNLLAVTSLSFRY